jgi:tubulin polyglutamylase TTLL4
MPEHEKASKKLYFKVSDKAPAYNCILNSFKYAGLEQTRSHKFNVIISKVPSPGSLHWLTPYQRFNHFPGAWNLGRKDNLWRNVWRMKRAYGSDYEICPMTYLFPEDYSRFQSDKEAADATALWILKPAASSCGRGIRVISKKTKLKKKSGYIVSKYISNPHTLNGFKYDLRIYVLVTSFNPLRIYMYQDGLARFATEAYSSHAKTIKKRYMHLTNYSVNRKAPTFQANRNAQQDNDGSKWSLKAWAAKLTELGVDVLPLMRRIQEVVIKAIIAAEPAILSKLAGSTQHRDVCFELYGFDILIDERMRPWLLEVNVGPSLSSSAPIDKRIKTTLMCDIYTLVGIAPYDRKKLKKLDELKKQSRLIRSERMIQHTPLQAVKDCASLDELTLGKTEICALMELEEEGYRRGHFDRIFPKKHNIDKFVQFFESDRLLNWVTWKYLKSPSRVLGPYMRRGSRLKV